MRKSISAFAACLLLLGVAVAGCGGGEGGSSTGAGGEVSTSAEAGGGEGEGSQGEAPLTDGSVDGASSKPLSKSQFAAAANTLCAKQQREAKAKVNEVFKSTQDEGSQGAGAQKVAVRRVVEEAIAPAMEAEAEGLRALDAPQGDEQKIASIASAIEASVAEARRDPESFLLDPKAFESAERLARRYGIAACGKPS